MREVIFLGNIKRNKASKQGREIATNQRNNMSRVRITQQLSYTHFSSQSETLKQGQQLSPYFKPK